ncbi:MAG: hypothetical protein GEU28_15045 [Dehalococcoidia bacterium]|nr:hypothetical protein [Dehalococcoidia bacterium]
MATLNLQVEASGGDVIHISNHSFSTNSALFNSGQPVAGIGRDAAARFDDVTVPAGSTIVSCHLTLTSDRNGQTSSAVNTNLRFEAADDPAAIANDTDWHTRSLGDPVAWDGIESVDVDDEFTSPDLASILQAVIDRGGWASGQALQLFWLEDGSSVGASRIAYSFDASETKAPKLAIEYTEPGAGGLAPAVALYHARHHNRSA